MIRDDTSLTVDPPKKELDPSSSACMPPEKECERRSSKIRGGLKWLALIGVILGFLYVARLILGMGTAAIHYANTPTFSEYVESHPVSDLDLAKRLPTGEAISENRQWSTGDVDPLQLVKGEGEFELGEAVLKIEIDHGNDNLLSMEAKFAVSLRREDWTHHGVHIEVSSLDTAENMRAVVVATLSDPEKMIGKDSEAVGGAIIDVFLVAGTDPSETYFQLDPDGNVRSGGTGMNTVPAIPMWQMVTGIAHNVEPLPEEGLIHHVRQRVSFDWNKLENGHSGPSQSFANHEVNTYEYSYEVTVSTKHSLDGGGGGDSQPPSSRASHCEAQVGETPTHPAGRPDSSTMVVTWARLAGGVRLSEPANACRHALGDSVIGVWSVWLNLAATAMAARPANRSS